MNDEALSKTMSYALRHKPEAFGLTLDEEGWVPVAALLKGLAKAFPKVTEEDLQRIAETSAKKRHEIKNGMIRACYGHSMAEKVLKVPMRPPEVLYHGTPRCAIESILKTGLQPRGRQYVHLSSDMETARIVGLRRDGAPAIFLVQARAAWAAGIPFYWGNETVWLADRVPPEYLELRE